MQFLHTMVRVTDLDASLHFYCDLLGMVQTRRYDSDKGRFSLIYLAAPEDLESVKNKQAPELELTYNWDPEDKYTIGRAFGHLAFRVENIYQLCEQLQANDIVINRPPRDGHMAFVRSPEYFN